MSHAGAEDDAGIEIGLATHEAAGYLCACAAFDDEVEPIAGSVGNRHEDGFGRGRVEDVLDLLRGAENGDTLKAPSAQAGVVVDEADDVFAARLSQLSQETAPGATGSDDQRSPSIAPPDESGQGAGCRSLPEARSADQKRADDGVDDEDAARKSTPGLRRGEKAERYEFRGDDGGDDARRVAGARVAPHSAIEAKRDECGVASEQDDRERDEKDVTFVRRAAVLQPDVIRGEEGSGDQREVDERLDQATGIGNERPQPRAFRHEREVRLAVDVRKQAAELHE